MSGLPRHARTGVAVECNAWSAQDDECIGTLGQSRPPGPAFSASEQTQMEPL